MSKIDKMNTYVSNLAIWNVKLHNLHWNVVGLHFMPIHKFTEELYDKVFVMFDDVAEQIKILGDSPLATTKDYLGKATIHEVETKNFAVKEVLLILKEDIALMKDLAQEIRGLADEGGDFSTVALFEDHFDYFSKNLWFLGSMLQ